MKQSEKKLKETKTKPAEVAKARPKLEKIAGRENILAKEIVNPGDVGIPFSNLNSFRLIKVLLKPRCLSNDDTSYSISRRDFASYLHYDTYRIFIRICLYSYNSQFQVDFLPNSFMLKINRNSYCIKNSYKRIPFDITKYVASEKACKISVQVKLCDYKFIESNYYFGVFLMKKNDHEDMINLLKIRTPHSSTPSLRLLRSLLGGDEEDDGEISISDDSLKVSLLCPISSQRIVMPVRSHLCKHVQCFDGENFIRLNNVTPRWKCPICRVDIQFADLFIDGLYAEMLHEAPDDCTEVLLYPEQLPHYKFCREERKLPQLDSKTLQLDDDDDDEDIDFVAKKGQIECIVIDSDDEEEEEENPRFENNCPLYPEVILE